MLRNNHTYGTCTAGGACTWAALCVLILRVSERANKSISYAFLWKKKNTRFCTPHFTPQLFVVLLPCTENMFDIITVTGKQLKRCFLARPTNTNTNRFSKRDYHYPNPTEQINIRTYIRTQTKPTAVYTQRCFPGSDTYM